MGDSIESLNSVSPEAFPAGEAAGRDQTWAVFGKGDRQPGGKFQQEKTDASSLAFKC